MNLSYALLLYILAGFNLFRWIAGDAMMNLIFAVVWCALGVMYTLRHIKEEKRKEENKKNRNREE